MNSWDRLGLSLITLDLATEARNSLVCANAWDVNLSAHIDRSD
jgi:hypothetical protein